MPRGRRPWRSGRWAVAGELELSSLRTELYELLLSHRKLDAFAVHVSIQHSALIAELKSRVAQVEARLTEVESVAAFAVRDGHVLERRIGGMERVSADCSVAVDKDLSGLTNWLGDLQATSAEHEARFGELVELLDGLSARVEELASERDPDGGGEEV